MKLKDIEDCEDCPLKKEGICPGGMTSDYRGEPVEPPCASWDEDNWETPVDEYIKNLYDAQTRIEEQLVRQEKLKKARKEQEEYLKSFLYAYEYKITKLKNKYKKLKSNIDCISAFVGAINITNEMFEYEERAKFISKEYDDELEKLKQQIKEAELNKEKAKQECLNSKKYKSIGEIR